MLVCTSKTNNSIGESVTVFITQEVPGRDITKASEFGDLQILIPAKEQVAYPHSQRLGE